MDGENPGRRARLPEAFVVLTRVVDEIGRSPDVDPALSRLGLGRLTLGPSHRDDCRERNLDRLLAVVGLATNTQTVALEREADRVRHLWAAEKGGNLGRHLPGLRIERLAAAEDEIRAFFP